MAERRDIPFSKMQDLSETGIFIKRFDMRGKVTMKPYAHRDDYYIVAMLTEGHASVEIDFERKGLYAGDILIVSPWQVHNRPKGELWRAGGWMLAFSPDMLSDAEARLIEEYSISPHPFSPGEELVRDIDTLCAMLERNSGNRAISAALAIAIRSIVFSSIDSTELEASGRYRAITLNLHKLLDLHLSYKKSPAAYADMLHISEIYLNEAVKGATGLSAGAYIRNHVIVQARCKLACTSLSSKEIAYSLGYDDYAYFSKLFKKCVGHSPSDYRKNLK